MNFRSLLGERGLFEKTRSCALLIKHTVFFIHGSQNVPLLSVKNRDILETGRIRKPRS